MPSVSNPLEAAISRGCVECIRILVDSSPFYSVDNCIGPDGLLPVHVASKEGHLQVLRYLQSAGACLQGIDSKGSNSLHYAARAGQIRAVRWLLRHNVNSCINSNLETPLHIASQNQHTEIVSILSKHQGTANTNTTSSPANAIEDSKQLDSGNSSLSSSTNPPASLTITTATNCSCTGTISSNSSDEINNYTIRSANSFFLHPPKSGSASSSNTSSSSSNPNSSSFYLHPRLIAGAIEEESSSSSTKKSSKSSSDNIVTISGKNNHNHDHSHSHSQSHSSSSTSCSSSSSSSPNSSSSKPIQPSFRLHSSPPPDSSSNNASNSFHLHQDDQHISSISVQQSLDYSIETTMAPVNNQFVISSPVVVQSESVAEMCKVINKSNGPTSSPVKISLNGNNKSNSNGNNGCPPPPPPPPPPPLPPAMPPPPPLPSNKLAINGKTLNSVHSKLGKASSTDLNVKKIIHDKEKVLKSVSINGVSVSHHNSSNNNNNSNGNGMIENDYEDIDEIQSQMDDNNNSNSNNSGNNNKINGHTVVSRVSNNNNRNTHNSPPPPPLPVENNNNTNNSCGNGNNNKILAGLKKLNVNGKQVPFIPPSFPTPPQQDQLIKPSEYLKSIKTNLKGTLSHGPRLIGGGSKVNTNDLILEVKEEETNAEDEFEEINPEIKIGTPTNNAANGHVKFAINHSNANNNTSGGGGGGIRPEELMKVNLRKTPTIRTKSAPILGRVLNGDPPVKGEIQSPTYGGVPPIPPPANSKAAVIAELEQSSQLGGVREWKEELRRRQLEEEKNAVKELAQHYNPVNFVSEVPNTDGAGQEIPAWKRQMLAKKAAERARKEAEEQMKMDAETKKMQAIPPWKRQLLQRRESDGKCQ